MSETPGRGYLPPTVPAPGPHRRQWPPPTYNFHYSSQWQPGKQFIMAPTSPQSESMDLSSRTEVNGSEINGTGVSVIAPNPLLGEEKPSKLQAERIFDPKPSDQLIPAIPKVFPSTLAEEKVVPPFATEVKMPNFPSSVKVPNPLGLMVPKISSDIKVPNPSVDVKSLKLPADVKLLNAGTEVKTSYIPGPLKFVNIPPDVKTPYHPSDDKLSNLPAEKNVPYVSTDSKVPSVSAEVSVTNHPTENKLPVLQPNISNSPNISIDTHLLNPSSEVKGQLEQKKPNPLTEIEMPNHTVNMPTSNILVETLQNHSAQVKVSTLQSEPEESDTSMDLRVHTNNTEEKIPTDLHLESKTSVEMNASTVERNSSPNCEAPVTSDPPKLPTIVSLDDKVVDPDHVESLLENMFQGEEKPSVIVTNNSRPVLTEDKVVEILQDKEVLSPIKEDPILIPKEEFKVEGKEESLVEPKQEPVVEPKEEPKENQFMEVESELEKMFAGIVEEKPQVLNEPVVFPSKKPKRPSKPRQRKSTDSADTKKRKAKGDRPLQKKTKREKENSNDSVVLNRSVRGPYIHVKGPKDNPSFVSVVNSAGKDEEEKERGDRRKHQSFVEGRLRGTNLYSSTLSSKYNSQSIDTTWVCSFCKQRAHCEGGLGGEPAGDLFGPYILNVPKPGDFDRGAPNDKDVSAEQKKKGGGGKAASLRAVGAIDAFITNFSKKSKKSLQAEELAGEKEIWVHEKCAIWAPGVYLAGSHLVGLAEAISSAAATKCSVCGAYGASVGCIRRNCSGRVHYGCGLSSGWLLNEEEFNSLCPTHSLKKEKIKNVT